jgi:hypothetical protein
MKSKFLKFATAAAIVSACCLVGGCAIAIMPKPGHYAVIERTAGEGESEIVFHRPGAYGWLLMGLKIFVDNEERLDLKTVNSGTIIVPNGRHTIRAVHPWGSWNGASRRITIDVENNRVVFKTRYGYVAPFIEDWIVLKVYAQFDLSSSSAIAQSSPPAASGGGAAQPASVLSNLHESMDDAIAKASTSVIKQLRKNQPEGVIIAIMDIDSDDKNISSAALDEVQFHFVSTPHFKVMERKKLDAIRQEQQFQEGDDVDKETRVESNKLAGASVVIAGDITPVGNKKRFSIKAMSVGTEETLSMAREDY